MGVLGTAVEQVKPKENGLILLYMHCLVFMLELLGWIIRILNIELQLMLDAGCLSHLV